MAVENRGAIRGKIRGKNAQQIILPRAIAELWKTGRGRPDT
jgi:hypothetical protein